MNKCEVCYKLHKNKRFCSIKCRNSVVQKLAVIAKQKSQITTKCANCGLVKKTNSIARKYCSHKCFTDSRRSTTRPSSPCVICGRMMDHLRYKPDGKRDLRVRIVCSNSCRGKKAAQGRISPKWTDKRRANHMKSMPRGENHVFWRGGVTPWQKIERKKPEYARWRTLVFERDNYTCVICGARGGELNADHIRSWIKYPELRLDLSNGRTLCVPCHRKTPTYAKNLKYQV